jgi:hypothetical protein
MIFIDRIFSEDKLPYVAFGFAVANLIWLILLNIQLAIKKRRQKKEHQ